MRTRASNITLKMVLDSVRNDAEVGRLFTRMCSPTLPAAALEALVLKVAGQFVRHYRDADGVEGVFARFASPTHYTLPDPPVSAHARLFALLPDDRLSRLPDTLLGNIVSRLPVKDAALSRRWRGVWRSTPLVLADADLFPVTSAVSCILAEHPGPFRCVHIHSDDGEGFTPDGSCNTVTIGHAPKLHLLGYLELDPGNHVLKVGNTVIKAGTRVSPITMVPSVRILAVQVRFDVRNDAKMIPSVLRCFPNLETLHIKSGKTCESTGKLNMKFWHESGTIECIRSHIKRLVFRDFRADRSELAFLNFFFESALVLEEVVILLGAGFTSMEEVHSKLKSLGSMKRASQASSVLVTGSCDPQGDYIQSLKRGSDFSVRDTFAYCSHSRCLCV